MTFAEIIVYGILAAAAWAIIAIGLLALLGPHDDDDIDDRSRIKSGGPRER